MGRIGSSARPAMHDDKAKLYRMVAQQANEFAVIERMRTLGFWPKGEPIPGDPPVEAAERANIMVELAALQKKKAALKDVDKALAEERQRRWEESKARRAEAKARRIEKQRLRRAAWDEHRSGTIVHVGPGHGG